MSIAQTVGVFAGGIGLFLLGMRLMTDGLRVAAGNALTRILSRSTRTKPRALLAGAAVTGLVQSSSAVTVATIGFVNAGILPLRQAVWVIFGSNVGTTMTGWIVAATGFDVDLEAISLPVVGLGMLLRLTGKGKRRGSLGEALAGFGLFFLGLGFLKTAFGDIAASVDLSALGMVGVVGALVSLLVGMLLTVATQSSSAAIALTLTAAASGLIDMNAAGAMVIGANLGTTSTAALSAIGATPNARRAAAAHVVFNLLAAALALLMLPWMLDALAAGAEGAGLDTSLATLLALFHTTFNGLGVLAVWPLSDRLVRLLQRRFRTREEDEAQPQHLDANVLTVPALALSATRKELGRVGHLACSLLSAAAGDERPSRSGLETRSTAFNALLLAVSNYLRRLDRENLSEDTARGLQELVRASQHYDIVVEQAMLVAKFRHDGQEHEKASKSLPAFYAAARDVADKTDPTTETPLSEAEQTFGVLQERYDRARAQLLEDVIAGSRDAEQIIFRQHLMAEVRRGAKHALRAAEAIERVRLETD